MKVEQSLSLKQHLKQYEYSIGEDVRSSVLFPTTLMLMTYGRTEI